MNCDEILDKTNIDKLNNINKLLEQHMYRIKKNLNKIKLNIELNITDDYIEEYDHEASPYIYLDIDTYECGNLYFESTQLNYIGSIVYIPSYLPIIKVALKGGYYPYIYELDNISRKIVNKIITAKHYKPTILWLSYNSMLDENEKYDAGVQFVSEEAVFSYEEVFKFNYKYNEKEGKYLINMKFNTDDYGISIEKSNNSCIASVDYIDKKYIKKLNNLLNKSIELLDLAVKHHTKYYELHDKILYIMIYGSI